MTLSKFKEQAALAGFSKILGGPASDFVLFDKDTDGRTGRPIFINGKLVDKFNNLGNEESMLYVFHRIKQLKAKAASISSYSNANDAMEYMNLVGKAKITYKLLAFTGDPQRKPGVYITDVDLANFSDGEAGVYRVQKQGFSWKLIDKRQRSVTSGLAAINGLCDDMQQAGTRIIPPMIESAYRDSKTELNAKGYDLFYNPPSLYDNNKEWKTPTQKKVTREVTAARLAHAMKDATARKQPVQWVVHGEGAKVLQQALQRAKGADLSGHTLMFMAPMETVADILPLARQSKMTLHNDVMKIHPHDGASKMAQMGSGRRLESELKQYGMGDQGELLKTQLRQDGITSLKALKGAGSAGFTAGAFLMSPTVPAMTVVGAIGAGFTIATAVDTAQAVRNRVAGARKITNPALNPHLTPHKSVNQLNQAAKKASGSLVKTFVDVVKAKRKGG